MRAVTIAALGPNGWLSMGSLSENEPCGSMSHNDPAGRQVFVFGFRDGMAGVWRSIHGVDVANDVVREIRSQGIELVANLDEQSVMIDVVSKRGITMRIRFCVEEVTFDG